MKLETTNKRAIEKLIKAAVHIQKAIQLYEDCGFDWDDKEIPRYDEPEDVMDETECNAYHIHFLLTDIKQQMNQLGENFKGQI